MPVLVSAVAMWASSANATPTYRLIATIKLGDPDRWDYVVPDPSSQRVFVAHGDRLAVIDSTRNVLLGSVEGITGGTHGTAISVVTGQGFTDDGHNGQAVAFDLKTLRIKTLIPAGDDADAVTIDPVTGHIFIIDGDPGTITVIDAKTDTAAVTISAGEKMEYALADGAGAIFVAGVEKGDILKIDALANRIVARWPVAGCVNPHGLAYDHLGKRIFMGCTNSVMMVVDASSGRIVSTLPIGRGSDAIAFDATRKRVFSSNGRDGSISVFQQTTPDRYEAMEPVLTAVSGRTIGVDTTNGHLFVAAADTLPNPTPNGRPSVVPGTLKLLVFAPND